MIQKILPCMFLFLFGCATLHEGNFAVPEHKSADKFNVSTSGVIISGRENVDLSSQYFSEVDFTFENKSAEWIHVKHVELDFGRPDLNAAVQIPVGNDLVAWATAAQQNKERSDYNSSLVLASVAVLGETLFIGAHDPAARGAGALLALGTIGGLSVAAINEERTRLQIGKLVPESHLLAEDFVIPPGLHTKKWITLYTKSARPRVGPLTLTYTLDNGKIERATLVFRAPSSEWQKD